MGPMAHPLTLIAVIPVVLGMIVFLVPLGGAVVSVANDPVLWESVRAYYVNESLSKGLLRSFLLPLVVTSFSLLIGSLSAIIYYWGADRVKTIVRAALLIPLFVHPMVLVFGLLVLLRQGAISHGIDYVFQWLGPHGGAWASVVAVMTLLLYPLVGWLLILAVDRVPWGQCAAASNLGARPLLVFRDVVLPHTQDALWAGAILVFVHATGFFIVPVLIGDGWVNTLPVLLVDHMEVGLSTQAHAIAVTLIVPITLLAIFGVRQMVKARVVT